MMHDRHVLIAARHGAGVRHQHLVHAPHPSKASVVAHAALAPEFAGGVAIRILPCAIFPIEAVHVRGRFGNCSANGRGIFDHIVGVQPEGPVAGGVIE